LGSTIRPKIFWNLEEIMTKRIAVTRIDSTYLPRTAPGQITHSSFSVPLPEMFDSREQAEEFVRTASARDTERRYVFGVNEVDEPESKALSS